MTAQPTLGTTGEAPADSGAPRPLAAVLLVVLALASLVLAVLLGEFYGVYRVAGQSVLYLVPWIAAVAPAVAAAVLLLRNGSTSARLLGVVIAVGLAVQTIAPLLGVTRLAESTYTLVALVVGAVVLLTTAVVAAVAVPVPPRRPSAERPSGSGPRYPRSSRTMGPMSAAESYTVRKPVTRSPSRSMMVTPV